MKKKYFRLTYNKILQLTEKSYISKEAEKCINDESYNPDKAIMELISKQINCTLPWSKFKPVGMKECRTENDFDRYLKMIFKRQDDIKQVLPKCKFKTWTPMPYSESSAVHKESSVLIRLSIIGSKVINKEEEEYLYSFDYFIGICGGYLGLFLGGSMLGILDFFEGIFTRIINRSLKTTIM